MKDHPRIAIGVPHGGIITSPHFFSYLSLALYEARKRPKKNEEDITKVDHLGSIIESPGCYIGMNRSIICAKFLEDKPNTHIMMIDTDISFTHNLLDIVTAHLDAFPEIGILAGRVNLGNGFPVFYKEEYGTQVMQVQPFHGVKGLDLVGTGVIVISRETIERMTKQYGTWLFAHLILPDIDGKMREYGDDFSFCIRARDMGINVFGAWGLYGQHWKMQPVPQNYPDSILNVAPMASRSK